VRLAWWRLRTARSATRSTDSAVLLHYDPATGKYGAPPQPAARRERRIRSDLRVPAYVWPRELRADNSQWIATSISGSGVHLRTGVTTCCTFCWRLRFFSLAIFSAIFYFAIRYRGVPKTNCRAYHAGWRSKSVERDSSTHHGDVTGRQHLL